MLWKDYRTRLHAWFCRRFEVEPVDMKFDPETFEVTVWYK